MPRPECLHQTGAPATVLENPGACLSKELACAEHSQRPLGKPARVTVARSCREHSCVHGTATSGPPAPVITLRVGSPQACLQMRAQTAGRLWGQSHLVHHTFTEHLLCARRCARRWKLEDALESIRPQGSQSSGEEKPLNRSFQTNVANDRKNHALVGVGVGVVMATGIHNPTKGAGRPRRLSGACAISTMPSSERTINQAGWGQGGGGWRHPEQRAQPPAKARWLEAAWFEHGGCSPWGGV